MSKLIILRKLAISLAMFAVVVFTSAATAKADGVTFFTGNVPQDDEENILLNIDGIPGNPIFGQTNQTQVLVRFTSNEFLLAVPPQGQAIIEAADGSAFNYLKIDVPNGTFQDLILNIDANDTGSVHFLVTTTTGNYTADFALTGSGQNFFTLLATGDTQILSVEFFTDVSVVVDRVDDVNQVRISGVQGGTAVPEPASMLLLGSGLIGVAAGLRKRFRKNS